MGWTEGLKEKRRRKRKKVFLSITCRDGRSAVWILLQFYYPCVKILTRLLGRPPVSHIHLTNGDGPRYQRASLWRVCFTLIASKSLIVSVAGFFGHFFVGSTEYISMDWFFSPSLLLFLLPPFFSRGTWVVLEVIWVLGPIKKRRSQLKNGKNKVELISKQSCCFMLIFHPTHRFFFSVFRFFCVCLQPVFVIFESLILSLLLYRVCE